MPSFHGQGSRFRGEKLPAQGHTAGKLQSKCANPGFLALSFSFAEHLLALEGPELWQPGKRECYSSSPGIPREGK